MPSTWLHSATVIHFATVCASSRGCSSTVHSGQICVRAEARVSVPEGALGALPEDRPAPKPLKSFEEAMSDVNSGAQKREEAFSKAADRTRNLQDLLDKKFEEARKKAKDEKGKPPSIFDLD